MRKQTLIMIALLLSGALQTRAQERPTVVVQPFALAASIAWPYDMKQLQTQAVAELQTKDAKKCLVSEELPSSRTHYFTLHVEILEWHPGNAAKRALVGMGSGRESARIRLELTDESGKKIFTHEDIIRTEFYASAYLGSVGQLAHPLADKIGRRIGDAKLQ
jgi:hypothetical protein